MKELSLKDMQKAYGGDTANDVMCIGGASVMMGVAYTTLTLGPVGWAASILAGAGAVALTAIC